MRTYATTVAVWGELVERGIDDVELPAPLPDLVRFASRLLERACRRMTYDVDSAGMPTDPELVEAFEQAVVEQVAFWVAEGIDPSRGAAAIQGTGEVTETKLGSGSAKLATNAGGALAARVSSVTGLTHAAWSYIETAYGSIGPGVDTWWRA